MENEDNYYLRMTAVIAAAILLVIVLSISIVGYYVTKTNTARFLENTERLELCLADNTAQDCEMLLRLVPDFGDSD